MSYFVNSYRMQIRKENVLLSFSRPTNKKKLSGEKYILASTDLNLCRLHTRINFPCVLSLCASTVLHKCKTMFSLSFSTCFCCTSYISFCFSFSLVFSIANKFPFLLFLFIFKPDFLPIYLSRIILTFFASVSYSFSF